MVYTQVRWWVVALCWFGLSISASAQPTIVPAPPALAAQAYILMDATTGQILVEHNADSKVPPASLTKMMTSYLLSEQIKRGIVAPTDMVTISKNAWAQNPLFNGSSLMWIEVGKQVSLDDLHRGIVISSGNDASVAVAEYLSGSEAMFVDMMNQQARLLGMSNTVFKNPHGLPDEEHLSTARDMALLARAIIQNHPEDYELYSEREYTFNHITQANRNNLLWRDPSVDGLKTGHTEAAGYCLVASAKKQNMRLISAVFGAASTAARESETQKLLAYGFRFFETRKLYSKLTPLAENRVWAGKQDALSLGLADDVYVTILRGRYKDLSATTELDQQLMAPVTAGAEYGVLQVKLDDEVLVDKPLVALDSVDKAGFFKTLWHKLVLFFERLLG